MTPTANAIRFRLSLAQIAVLWPGLDLIIRLYVARQTKGGIRYQYPFMIHPPPVGFDRGAFDQQMMDGIVAFWKRLHPKSKTGGRVQMNALELRAAVFAIRTHIDFVRKSKGRDHRSSSELKARVLTDEELFGQLKIRSQRVIGTLERHMKRANRVLLKAVAEDAYATIMDVWTKHLSWMRLHIVYFKPLRSIISKRRIQQQQDLDELMKIAERGLQNAGYKPPEAPELRRMMRLYVRSARRWREGRYTVQHMLEKKRNFTATYYLAHFVLDRLTLEKQ